VTYDVDDLLQRDAERHVECIGLVQHRTSVLDVATVLKYVVYQPLLMSTALHA